MVELIPKRTEGEVPLGNVPLFVAGALLLVVVLSYVMILRVETGALTSMGNLEDGIAKVGTRQDKQIESKVFSAEKKVKDFAVLRASRRKSSVLFDNLSAMIHPQVWFSSVELDINKMEVLLSGQSPDFKVLEQQLVFFQNQDNFIESVGLSNMAIGKDGGAEFDIKLNFKPEIFNKQK